MAAQPAGIFADTALKMPRASFIRAFVRASQDAVLTGREIQEIKAEIERLPQSVAKPAAELFDLVVFDHELNAHKAARVRELLAQMGATPAELQHLRFLPECNVTIEHLDLALDLRRAPHPCRAELTLGAAAPTVAVLEANERKLRVQQVTVDGVAVPFAHANGRLTFRAGGARQVTIDYALMPTPRLAGTGLITHRGETFSLTWPESIRDLFPGDSRPEAVMTSTIDVRTPPGYTVAASGEVVARADGHARFELKAKAPAFAVAVYATRQGEVLRASPEDGGPVYVSRRNARLRPLRQAYLEVARHTLAFMQRWFGPTPLAVVSAVVEAPGAHGGMDHAGAVQVSRYAASDRDLGSETVSHEIIHQWFGSGVRRKHRADFWLREGMAVYLATRAIEDRLGGEAYRERLTDGAKYARRDLAKRLRSDTRYPLRPAYDHVPERAIFDWVTYEMGAWVLVFFEREVGRQRFDKALAGWFRQADGSAASTAEFFAFMGRELGRDLTAFKARWVDNLPTVAGFDEAVARVVDGKAAPVASL